MDVMKDYIGYQKEQKDAALERQERMHREKMGAFNVLTEVLKSFADKH